VRRDAEVAAGAGDAGRAEEVDLDRAVERAVEADRRRRVDDDVAGGEGGAAGVVESEPSRPTSPATTWTRRRELGEPVLAEVERRRSKRRCEDLALEAALDRGRLPGRTRRTTSHSGTIRSSRSSMAVPRKPVVPVTRIRLPASASGITPCCLPFGK
jgi:hypothetical protein